MSSNLLTLLNQSKELLKTLTALCDPYTYSTKRSASTIAAAISRFFAITLIGV